MNFGEAENYLLSLGNEVSTMKLGLENISTLLDALGRPQEKYLKVQVAGTNGKGSVCSFLDAICNAAGIKTGTFTSPHLISITERVRINGEDISETEFARVATLVRGTSTKLVDSGDLSSIPTFFEQVTAIALVAFADAGVDLAILETGLGGRLDATTAANAEIAAITRIDLDHQQYLGETIEEIAAEKAAIITEQTLEVVIGEQSSEVMAILCERCSEFAIKPLNDDDVCWRVLPTDGDMVDLDLPRRFPRIRLGIRGRHQIENAQTAIRIVLALYYHSAFPDLEDADEEVFIFEGLQKARHPGRLEYRGRYLFDGAHNAGGVLALAAYLEEFESRPVTLVFGAMQDKDVTEMLGIITPRAKHIVLTEPSNSRAARVEDLLGLLPNAQNTVSTTSVDEALTIAESSTSEDGIILVTGSLYLVGEVKKLIAEREFQI